MQIASGIVRVESQLADEAMVGLVTPPGGDKTASEPSKNVPSCVKSKVPVIRESIISLAHVKEAIVEL